MIRLAIALVVLAALAVAGSILVGRVSITVTLGPPSVQPAPTQQYPSVSPFDPSSYHPTRHP